MRRLISSDIKITFRNSFCAPSLSISLFISIKNIFQSMFVVFQILNRELDITRTILFYLGNLLFSQRFF